MGDSTMRQMYQLIKTHEAEEQVRKKLKGTAVKREGGIVSGFTDQAETLDSGTKRKEKKGGLIIGPNDGGKYFHELYLT